MPNRTRWTAGATKSLPGEEKEVEDEDAQVDDGEPGGDAPGNDKGLLAEKKDSAQQERGEDQDEAEQIELAGGGQGAEAGDDQQEERDLEEMLDFRRGSDETGGDAGRGAGGFAVDMEDSSIEESREGGRLRGYPAGTVPRCRRQEQSQVNAPLKPRTGLMGRPQRWRRCQRGRSAVFLRQR